MQPSPASASSAVTTASGDAYSSFGATAYSPSNQAQTQAHLAHYNNVNAAATATLAEFPTPAAANSWAINMAFDDLFLPELVGAGDFPNGDLFGGGFGTLLQDNNNRASSTLQELSACYFPNAQAEMWADIKPPPPSGAGLCPSLT
jgi:myb proto-oncogene protein